MNLLLINLTFIINKWVGRLHNTNVKNTGLSGLVYLFSKRGTTVSRPD